MAILDVFSLLADAAASTATATPSTVEASATGIAASPKLSILALLLWTGLVLAVRHRSRSLS